jgi:hypothetical protein
MTLHLAWRDSQAVRDVGVAVAINEQHDDFELAWAELFAEAPARCGFVVGPLGIRLVFADGR